MAVTALMRNKLRTAQLGSQSCQQRLALKSCGYQFHDNASESKGTHSSDDEEEPDDDESTACALLPFAMSFAQSLHNA